MNYIQIELIKRLRHDELDEDYEKLIHTTINVLPQDYVILADMFNQSRGLGLSSQTLTFLVKR